ncbi:MAG: dihydrofolate reductase [Patescibacteria group bacterium]
MTEIIIIAALAQNHVIGSKNAIPWRISDDFKRFKSLTLGHPCIMGETTYKSLPEKARPLPGRENIVLTFDPDFHPEGTTIFHDFNEAIAYVRAKGEEKAFITGGASIYALGLNVADTMELTRIHRDFDGDVRFPEFNPNDWDLVSSEDHKALDSVSNTVVGITYETYKRGIK